MRGSDDERAAQPDAVPVGEFVAQLRGHVRSLGCRGCAITGRVSSFKFWRDTHIYFDLVDLHDEEARVQCVVFRADATVASALCDGAVAHVRVKQADFHKGRMQIVASTATRLSSAALTPRELTLGQLYASGLVERAKKPLPEIPRHVCLVTAVGSAAHHDMLKSIDERWPGMRVTTVDTIVQGEHAVRSIVRAMGLARAQAPDVIVCARGGGSESDLAAFDTLPVAGEMVADCAVVSAVGHETDTTACDHVADVRAKTPTAAIEAIIPETLASRRAALHEAGRSLCAGTLRRIATLADATRQLRTRMHTATQAIVARHVAAFRSAATHLRATAGTSYLQRESVLVDTRDRLVAACVVQCNTAARGHRTHAECLKAVSDAALERVAHALEALRARVDNACPLAHGRDAIVAVGKRRLRTAAGARPGDQICAHFADGVVVATVIECRRQKPRTLPT